MMITMAWRNLWRRKQRALFTALAMGVGVGLSMGMMALQSGIFDEVFDEMVTDSLGHVQVHQTDYPTTRHQHQTLRRVTPLLHQLEALPSVAVAVPRIFTAGLAGGEREATGALIIGVDPQREATLSEINREISEGRWLHQQPQREAVLGHELAREIKADLGAEIALVGQDTYGGIAQGLYRVVGLVESGMTELDQGGLWIHLTDAQEFLDVSDQAHEILIAGAGGRAAALSSGERLAHLKSDVSQVVSTSQSDVVVKTWREAKPAVSKLIDTQTQSSYVMLMIVMGLVALGVLNTMLMSIYERTRELGIMLAIGVKPRTISGLVIIETLYLATLAAVIGLVIGFVADWCLIEYGVKFTDAGGQGLSYGGIRLSPRLYGVFEMRAPVLSIAALYGATLLASLWPAWRASRLEPVEAIQRGERT